MEQEASDSPVPTAGQRRMARLFNVHEAQVMLDNIPTDYNTCTDEEPDSDPDDPDFEPDPLPSAANIDRLSLAASNQAESSDEETCEVRPAVSHQWRTRPFDKQEREFTKHEGT